MNMLLWCLFGFLISVQCAPQFDFDFKTTDVEKLEELSRNKPVNMSSARFRRRCVEQLVNFPFFIEHKNHELSEESRKTILKSLDHYTNRTCLRFKEVDNEQSTGIQSNDTYIILHFEPSFPTFSKDFSFIPPYFRWRSEELLVLHIPLNNGLGDVELGHVNQQLFYALQFMPENYRPDRDNYVTVLWENIKRGYDIFFKKSPSFDDIASGFPYDFNSISHYYPDYFAIERKNTLVSKVANTTLQRNTELSSLDVHKINTFYCGKYKSSQSPETTEDYDNNDDYAKQPDILGHDALKINRQLIERLHFYKFRKN